MNTAMVILGYCCLIGAAVSLVRLLISLKKSLYDCRPELVSISHALMSGFCLLVWGKAIAVSEQTELWLGVSFAGLTVLMIFPGGKAKRQRENEAQATQVARQQAETQEPPPLRERIGNR